MNEDRRHDQQGVVEADQERVQNSGLVEHVPVEVQPDELGSL